MIMNNRPLHEAEFIQRFRGNALKLLDYIRRITIKRSVLFTDEESDQESDLDIDN